MAVAPMKTKPQTLYEQAFRESLARQQEKATFPAWLADLKKTALARFETLGFPTRRWEAWRYIDLDPVLSQRFVSVQAEKPATLPPAETLAPSLYDEARHSRLVFLNGAFSPQLSQVENLPNGVVIGGMADAFHTQEVRLSRVLSNQINEEENPFVSLNTALFENGPFVYVPDNTELKQPVQVLFLSRPKPGRPQATYSRGVFIVGENSQVNLVVGFFGLDEQDATPYLNNSVVDLVLNRNAHVTYSFTQSETPEGRLMATTRVSLQAGAQVAVTSVALGGKLSRHQLEAEFQGEDARCTLNGLSVLNHRSEVFDFVHVNHVVGHCTSEQLYKGILDGHARSEFTGTISIRNGAKQTDAAQLNRNLLLSNDARVFTRPQLRIDDDDVKCSHGATVGQLDEEQLFYLASRGLDLQVAKNVLTYGFAEEIVEKIPVASVRTHLNTLINRNLNPGNEVNLSW